MKHPRTAIVDVGSNSVRLVVYQGPERLPATIFNEKVMAGLGRSLSDTGRIDEEALETAQRALARFAMLARELKVDQLRTVATAAVRDASNGGELIAAAEKLGLEVELLSGEEEATASGLGVLSGIPDANGIVGDLGGGSLELVRIVAGTVTDRISYPLGVLRLGAIRAGGKGALDREVTRLISETGWKGRGKDLPFYMVGGSWRGLARLDMHLTEYPLPIAHQYALSIARVKKLREALRGMPKGELKAIPNLSGSRAATLEDATALLESVVRELGSSEAIVSAFGLREGLLFQRLSAEKRREDPLIAAARYEGQRLGRFSEHGDLLHAWIAPLFDQDSDAMERLRHAACLLADVGWRSNPEFRDLTGMEEALHGNWVSVDAESRAILAQTLYTALGGETASPAPLGRLADFDLLHRAKQWGLAIRLGQRLSGGVAGPLKRSALSAGNAKLTLRLKGDAAALYGEAVEKRHKALAAAMGLDAVLAA